MGRNLPCVIAIRAGSIDKRNHQIALKRKRTLGQPTSNTSEDGINSYSYKSAGVDIDEGARLVEEIKPLAASTARPGAVTALGGFAGIFDLKAAGFADPLLLAASDGVGTKLKVAIAAGKHDSIGIDLVAMCVNDLVVQGGEPLLFLDYYATGKLEVSVGQAIVAGIANGCRQAGCALLGGETAEMPGLYAEGDYDLAGFAVGAVEREAIVTGESVTAGDVLIGLASSGLHSNGFSLVNRLIGDFAIDIAAPAPFAAERVLADELLTPTRIYVPSCLAALKGGRLKALAHITGGGMLENIPRVIPDGLRAEIDASTWTPPAVFRWLAELGGMNEIEMARTFNCGIGMVAVCAEADAVELLRSFTQAGETAVPIGRIVACDGTSEKTLISGLKI